jgi:Tfp pilus assembly protein PilV
MVPISLRGRYDITRARRCRAEEGLSIIEVMMASFLLLAVTTGVFTAVYGGLRLQGTARQRATATAWADHLMELARNQNYDAVGLSSTGAEIDAAMAAVPASDTDNPELLLRRNTASNCLEFNTATAASPVWERLIVADGYTAPDAAASCTTQAVNNDFHLVHAGGANNHVAAGTPAVTYSGWVFATWAPVDGFSDVYFKRVTVMVRFPAPTGGISRLVRTSSLFSLGYVPAPSVPSTSTPTSTSTSTTTITAPTSTLPAGCLPKAGDTQGPAGSISLAGGGGYTSQSSVAINNSVSDLPNGSGASGMAIMQYSNTGPSGPWQPSPAAAYGAVYSGWPVTAGDGVKQVWARFTDCNGNPNASVIADTIVVDQTRPPAPTLSGRSGSKRVDLSWNATTDPGGSASGVDSYRIYRFDKGTATPMAVVAGTSYTDNQLTNGQAYTYWVKAVDRAGNESQESNHVTATPT